MIKILFIEYRILVYNILPGITDVFITKRACLEVNIRMFVSLERIHSFVVFRRYFICLISYFIFSITICILNSLDASFTDSKLFQSVRNSSGRTVNKLQNRCTYRDRSYNREEKNEQNRCAFVLMLIVYRRVDICCPFTELRDVFVQENRIDEEGCLRKLARIGQDACLGSFKMSFVS